MEAASYSTSPQSYFTGEDNCFMDFAISYWKSFAKSMDKWLEIDSQAYYHKDNSKYVNFKAPLMTSVRMANSFAHY